MLFKRLQKWACGVYEIASLEIPSKIYVVMELEDPMSFLANINPYIESRTLKAELFKNTPLEGNSLNNCGFKCINDLIN